MAVVCIESPHGAERFAEACGFLRAQEPGRELLVLGASIEAANTLIRGALAQGKAVFGWQRLTLNALAARLATTRLARRGVVVAPRLSLEAVCARVVAQLAASSELGRFEAVQDRPGLARALANTVFELGQARVDPALLETEPAARDLGRLWAAYQKELAAVGLTDRAGLLSEALDVARSGSHAFARVPVVLYDLRVTSALEAELIAALVQSAPQVYATLPSGDASTRRYLEQALGVSVERRRSGQLRAVERVQANLFEAAAETGSLDDSVSVLSAPGESRESVELARRMLAEARRGVPFDRMAVLLRAPEQYRVHLETALHRAGIPAYFSQGTRRPEPSGRAFLALLACAAEGLSARRFAEYLSLGAVPRTLAGGAPPPQTPREQRFVAPADEALPPGLTPAQSNDAPETSPDGASLRAPRRWEKLLVDASVIGGRERWARRLNGLCAGLQAELAELVHEDEPRAARLQRDLAQLESLHAFALPLIDDLAALPSEARWGTWLDALSALATRALASPNSVLEALAELNPLAPVGPVGMAEVRVVLEARLGDLRVLPKGGTAGKVWVGSAEEARGLVFDVVFVPGLAERLFPQKVLEDPLLLDGARRALSAHLPTNDERIGHERIAFRVAAGAAAQRLVLSYPRVDVDEGRPRVPSFYALEALRAAEGALPGFDELVRRAEKGAAARIGWPAPPEPAQAIDPSEYDLAMLDRFLRQRAEESRGAAHYLLHANPHLARALRFRGRRWKFTKWFPTDGFVEPSPTARAALARHRLSERAYSATALERYAACPYKFYLGAIVGLAPRASIAPIDELNAAQRGQLIHELQRLVLSELKDAGLLPVSAARLAEATERLERAVEHVATEWRDRLAPAIDRVWDDAIASIRFDLREWLAGMCESSWVPVHFELGFGLPPHPARDPASQSEAVELECGLRLRGAIDMVEQWGDTVRATDHKTGRRPVAEGFVIGKGSVLQPVLYALALERLLPSRVASGRLHYCTTDAGFVEREVPLDTVAREAAVRLAKTIDAAIDQSFLPAAPGEGACQYCEYAVVCGPYESLRSRRKPKRDIEPLLQLRCER
ncbi:MAG TPA: PD-(D/E)XK nuclease family protein [Polyangiaceae bacterium]|nr:PD-(D/E)XK nuclease family protein [Polyangiaceae bacterium]